MCIRDSLQTVREQTAKQLPAPELIAHAAEEKAKAEAKSEEQEREIDVYKRQIYRQASQTDRGYHPGLLNGRFWKIGRAHV